MPSKKLKAAESKFAAASRKASKIKHMHPRLTHAALVGKILRRVL